MRLLIIALFLSLSACAFTPQQVHIEPSVKVTSGIGNGQNISVIVEDQRPQQIIGNRSGDTDHDSNISIANNISESIANTTKEALIAQGFKSDASLQADVSMHIYINQLSYKNTEEGQHDISLLAELKTTVKKGPEFYKGHYKTQTQHSLGISPSSAKNNSLINEVLSKSLQNLLDDPKSQAFLLND